MPELDCGVVVVVFGCWMKQHQTNDVHLTSSIILGGIPECLSYADRDLPIVTLINRTDECSDSLQDGYVELHLPCVFQRGTIDDLGQRR